jgi:hypothetical protein
MAAVGSKNSTTSPWPLQRIAVAPAVRVVLRAGDSEAIAETRSAVPDRRDQGRDRLSATYVVLALRGLDPEHLCSDGVRVYARSRAFTDCTSIRRACTHGDRTATIFAAEAANALDPLNHDGIRLDGRRRLGNRSARVV